MNGVVVHLAESEANRQSTILRNVLNLRADLGPDVPIELVAHGAGVDLLIDESGLDEEVRALNLAGVRTLACLNTLASRGLTPDDLFPEAETVPSGVGHLARRQLEGWAYLRL